MAIRPMREPRFQQVIFPVFSASFLSVQLHRQQLRHALGQVRQEKGFTLIEIMVVIVILGVLAAMIVPRIMDRPDQARLVKAKQDVRVIENALKLYRLDLRTYPTTDQGLEALIEKPQDGSQVSTWKEGGYLDRVPVDPWGNRYQYLNPGVHAAIDVYSLGADGRPGGEGLDADIGNWNID